MINYMEGNIYLPESPVVLMYCRSTKRTRNSVVAWRICENTPLPQCTTMPTSVVPGQTV